MLSMCHWDDEDEDEDDGYSYKKLKKHHKTKKDYDDDECYTSTGEEMIDEINSYYKDFNKGKSCSAAKKFYDGVERSRLNKWYEEESVLGFLYTIAIINLIVQIFGILLWACGRFLGMIIGGSDAKTPSDGEA